MKFIRFLSVFLSLFFILIGMEKVLGMESVSEKCEVCHKGEYNFVVFDDLYLADLKKVCGWNCAMSYMNECESKFLGYKLSEDDFGPDLDCSICKSKLSKIGTGTIMRCGCVMCAKCRVFNPLYKRIDSSCRPICPYCKSIDVWGGMKGMKFPMGFYVSKNTKENLTFFSELINTCNRAKDLRGFFNLQSNKSKLKFKLLPSSDPECTRYFKDWCQGIHTEGKIALLARYLAVSNANESIKENVAKVKTVICKIKNIYEYRIEMCE